MDNIRQLIELNIEIEGLLRVAEHRNSETIESLLLCKAKHFLDILNSTCSDGKSDSVIFNEVSSFGQVNNDEDASSDVSSSDTAMVSRHPEILESQETAEEIETVLNMDDDIDVQTEDNAIGIEPPLFIPYLTQDKKEKDGASVKASSQPVDDDYVMRVDEMIHRQSSRNLKKAFSINDRFRYIQEIFSNNSEYFDDTLRRLDTFPDMDAVYDYLLGELGLNHEDQTVKEFLSIIYNHFNA